MLAALLLGAFAAGSCLVYGPEDLPGNGGKGPTGGGTAGRSGGAPNTGGSGGGGGAEGGLGGRGAGGSGTAGTAGSPSAGAGMAGSAGHGGVPGMGGTGAEAGMDDGGAPPGGTTNGGTAGTTSGTGGTVGPPKTLLEDMEDGNDQIRLVQDDKGTLRNGYWYMYVNGKSETLEPQLDMITMTVHPTGMPGPAGIVSTKGFRLLVSDVTPNDVGYGAAAAFNILNGRRPYDASRYTGISYYLRASRPMTIRFQIVTTGTDDNGGICDKAMSKCSDHFFKEEVVGTSWNSHRGSWMEPSEFAQEGWGTPVDFDPSQIVAIQFFVPSHVTTPEIELWIDDVSFVEP